MGATKSAKTGKVNEKNSGQTNDSPKIIVKALFTDYDGTISPININRSKSAVSPKIRIILKRISQRIPVAIITTKDTQFVVKRTPFAHAWATLGGLEIKAGRVATRTPLMESKIEQVNEAMHFAKDLAGDDLTIEEKQDSEGIPVAFSVDWRQTKNKDRAASKSSEIIACCETFSLSVTKYEGQPFFDVFPCPIDKGAALLNLKKKFGLQDGVLYLGDSATDNAAFEKADIAVGILHNETPSSLICDYFVETEQLSVFLECILKEGFGFNSEWPFILSRDEAMEHIQGLKLALK